MGLLSHRRIIITGASRGLGLAVAQAFHAEGAELLLAARSLAELQAVKAALGVRLDICACDISAPDAASLLFAGDWVAPDVLINNAAIQGPIGPSWVTDWQAWRQSMEINLFAALALSRAVLPKMIERGSGKIINLSGGGATAARPGFAAYAIAKTALVRFTECLAQELKGTGVDVNCIAPGAMPTDMLESVVQTGPEIAGQREYDLALKARETGQETMAKATALGVYLASSQSDGITGKLISAQWDPWADFQAHRADLDGTDIYTLRRIVPAERGKEWGK